MDNTKLRQLIARQNEQLEQSAASEAASIINEIAEYQQAKVDAETAIAGLREKLKKLTVQQIDPISILGGD